MIQWKAVKDFKTDGCIFFRYHWASDLAGPACLGFFAWRSFHDRDGRHAQKLRSCVHFQHIQGVQLICVPLGFVIFVNDQTFTNYRYIYIGTVIPKKIRRNHGPFLGWSVHLLAAVHPTNPQVDPSSFFFLKKASNFRRVPHLPKISHWKTHT